MYTPIDKAHLIYCLDIAEQTHYALNAANERNSKDALADGILEFVGRDWENPWKPLIWVTSNRSPEFEHGTKLDKRLEWYEHASLFASKRRHGDVSEACAQI
jgi:hypothetical protein